MLSECVIVRAEPTSDVGLVEDQINGYLRAGWKLIHVAARSDSWTWHYFIRPLPQKKKPKKEKKIKKKLKKGKGVAAKMVGKDE